MLQSVPGACAALLDIGSPARGAGAAGLAGKRTCLALLPPQIRGQMRKTKALLREVMGHLTASAEALSGRPGSAGASSAAPAPAPAAAAAAAAAAPALPVGMVPPGAGRGRGRGYAPPGLGVPRPAYNPLTGMLQQHQGLQPPLAAAQQYVPAYRPQAGPPLAGRGPAAMPGMAPPAGRGRGAAAGRGYYRPPGAPCRRPTPACTHAGTPQGGGLAPARCCRLGLCAFPRRLHPPTPTPCPPAAGFCRPGPARVWARGTAHGGGPTLRHPPVPCVAAAAAGRCGAAPGAPAAAAATRRRRLCSQVGGARDAAGVRTGVGLGGCGCRCMWGEGAYSAPSAQVHSQAPASCRATSAGHQASRASRLGRVRGAAVQRIAPFCGRLSGRCGAPLPPEAATRRAAHAPHAVSMQQQRVLQHMPQPALPPPAAQSEPGGLSTSASASSLADDEDDDECIICMSAQKQARECTTRGAARWGPTQTRAVIVAGMVETCHACW